MSKNKRTIGIDCPLTRVRVRTANVLDTVGALRVRPSAWRKGDRELADGGADMPAQSELLDNFTLYEGAWRLRSSFAGKR
jgi:hypothetical protein